MADQTSASPGIWGETLQTTNHSHNRIPVFISSSMRNEGNFSWRDLRRRIDDSMGASPLFDSFIIERNVSPRPSRDFYLHRVERSAIVVALIRCELRPGTEDEIRHAIDCHKSLILILIGTNRDEATKKLLRTIDEADYCTHMEVEDSHVAKLPETILSQLNQRIVELAWDIFYDADGFRTAAVDVGSAVRYSIPKSTLAAFGNSSSLISKRLGYPVDDILPDGGNPYLAPLGNNVVTWIMEGKTFTLENYLDTIKLAMKHSGISEDVLELRLKALGCFINGDYAQAGTFARQACDALTDKESWLYGNCLIDVRNLSYYETTGSFTGTIEIQRQLDDLKVPTVFPIADHFRESAFSRTLNTMRKFRTLRPNSSIFGSNPQGVLEELCSHAFIALLYGSVASFEYSRLLVAHALLDYAELYEDSDLAFQGIKLLLLTGQSSEFTRELKAKSIDVTSMIKESADELWMLSGRAPGFKIPSIRCALIQQAVPYFSDSVFPEVEGYLTSNSSLFTNCLSDWIRALNSCKLRMNDLALSSTLTEIIEKHLYFSAREVGNIIAGAKLADYSRESITLLYHALREHKTELVKDGLSLIALAVVEERAGKSLVDDALLSSVSEAQRGAYLGYGRNDSSTLDSLIEILWHEYEANNVSGYHAESGFNVVPAICQLLDQGCTHLQFEKLEYTLTAILKSIEEYKGFSVALDQPLSVLCRFICEANARRTPLADGWLPLIQSLNAGRHVDSNPIMFPRYDSTTLRVRMCAVKAVADSREVLSFLTDGISLDNLSYAAQVAYLESLEWMIASGTIQDDFSLLTIKLSSAASEFKESQPRIKALYCLAACSKRWGMKDTENSISTLTRDPDSNVVYHALTLCQRGAFGDSEFEKRVIETLSKDANWFIRWHALNG